MAEMSWALDASQISDRQQKLQQLARLNSAPVILQLGVLNRKRE